MLFQRIVSEGISQYSYCIGSQTEALVIDPRRDCDVYVDLAHANGMRITTILETHRSEDFVSGSRELQERTGAKVLHSGHDNLTYGYGEPIHHGEELSCGDLRIRALHTPGHTPGHMSYLLLETHGHPWILFSGDALVAGDVGRTDLQGKDKTEEMSTLLFDTLHNRIGNLDDGVILCPAHGSDNSCSKSGPTRDWTTLGLERLLNPWLRMHEKEFVAALSDRSDELPPYYETIQALNLTGPPVLGRVPKPQPLAVNEFVDRITHARVLDSRTETAFNSAHIPGSLSIWTDGIPYFGGWFLPYDLPLLLVSESSTPERESVLLYRLGFDRIDGFLSGGMHQWLTSGQPIQSTRTVSVQSLCRLLDQGEDIRILDVRSTQEWNEKRIPIAEHIPVTRLPEKMNNIPRDKPFLLFSNSGRRSTIGAGLLQEAGITDAGIVLGGLSGWNSISCPL
ncbi:MAG: MBL fold metallo-hydrolase [Desulfovibrionales bacterium]